MADARAGAPAAGMDVAEATLPADTMKARRRCMPRCAGSFRLRCASAPAFFCADVALPAAFQADAHGRQGGCAHQARGRLHPRRWPRPRPGAWACDGRGRDGHRHVSAARARCGRCTPFIWRFCPRISACNAHTAVLPAWRARFQRPWLPWAFLGASSAGGPNRHSVARSAAAHAAPRSRAPQLSPRRTRQRPWWRAVAAPLRSFSLRFWACSR